MQGVINRHIILFVLLLSLLGGNTVAQTNKVIKTDSSKVTIREMRNPDDYRAQKAFDYTQKINRKPPGWWDRFWNWLGRLFSRMADSKGVSLGFKVFFWALAIFIILLAILRLAGMDAMSVFTRKRPVEEIPYTVESDDIYALDFTVALQKAIDQKNFRLAVRILYLQTLRKLADRQLIDWKLNKTNYHYIGELRPGPHGAAFTQLTRTYEYAWYGEFPVSEAAFKEVRENFNGFQQKI
jgi:Domain of unknown function (DUF4129)